MTIRVGHISLDILVLFQMLQHCKDVAPESSTGQLLGIDIYPKENETHHSVNNSENVDIYISHSYPFPHQYQHHHQHRLDEETAEEANTYQMEMLRYLRDAHVDHQIVGWYAVVSSNKAFPVCPMMNHAFLETQFGYQQTLPFSVLLLLDEEAARYHSPCIRAYRLSELGMQLCQRHYSPDGYNVHHSRKPMLASISPELLVPEHLFTTVPIQVTVNTLSRTLSGWWPHPSTFKNTDSYSLSPPSLTQLVPLLSSRMEALLVTLDAHATELGKFQHYQKSLQRYQQMMNHALTTRKTENEQRIKRGEAPLPEETATSHLRPPFEPARLDDAIWQHQLKALSEHLNCLAEIGLQRICSD